MKPKLSVWVCLLISLALVVFGVVYGASTGFARERKAVEACLTGDDGLLDALDTCGADALNLSVVAGRHLSGDADVKALQAAGRTLRDGSADLSAKSAALDAVQAKLEAVAQKLGQSETFRASSRDVQYLKTLSESLRQELLSPKINTYNEAAKAYNAQLDDAFSGFLAKLSGAKPCALFE